MLGFMASKVNYGEKFSLIPQYLSSMESTAARFFEPIHKTSIERKSK
jgi:hypothetical protein